MKKFLTFAFVLMFVMCLFAISVSAEGAQTNEYGEVTEVEGVTVPSVIDSTSKVVIEASDGTFYTFPSYYILEDNSYFTWKKNDGVNAVLGVSDGARDLRLRIVRMEIPEGIVAINTNYNGGAYAFEDATKIVEVTLPSSLTRMGGYVFNRCSKLATINGMEGFMSRVQELGELMLNGTPWGEGFDLVIPANITSVPRYCFFGTKIASVTFNEGLTVLGERAFGKCPNIESVTFPSTLTNLKNHVFESCTKLESIDVSKCTKLAEIGEYCFENSKITSFDFTPFVKTFSTLGNGVFNGCKSLTTVIGFELCDKINSVPYKMFNQCPLTEINFPKNITSIGAYAYFNHKSTLTEIRIPNDVTTIGDHAFVPSNGAASGITIYLSGKLSSITGSYNFEYWSYNVMYIPKGITSISEGMVNGTKQSGVIYYYSGVKDGFTINQKNNPALLNSVWVDYSEFDADTRDTSKNYIVYNYNHCDAFYYGYDNDADALDCTKGTTCDRCGRSGESFRPYEDHNRVESFTVSSLLESGKYVCDCTNDNCTVIDADVETKPVFTAKGYSTNPDKNAINGGYTVDLTSLALYEKFIGEITYGIVIANANTFGENPLFNSEYEVNSEKSLKVEMDKQYSNFDCEINFGANTGIDLDLVICAYVITDDGVVFVQKDTGNDVTIGDTTFKSVTLAQVIALVPAESKEN